MTNWKKGVSYSFLLIVSLLIFALTGAYFAVSIFVFLILLLLVNFFMMKISGKSIECQITGSKDINLGENGDFDITIKNNSIFPLFSGKAECDICNLLNGQKDIIKTNWSIGPFGKERIKVNVKTNHCGCLRISMETLEVRDPMGLFTKDVKIDVTANHYALPSKGNIAVEKDSLSKYDMESYKYSPYKSGSDSSEVFDIRDYKPGDKIKSIHWNLSAKAGQIMTKEASFPIDNNLILILDKCVLPDEQTIDTMMSLFISLSSDILCKGINHSLGWYDKVLGKFHVETVRNEDDIWSSIRKCSASPFEDGESSIYHLIEADIEKTWASYLYITIDERDIERLRNYGEVSIFRPENFK